MDISEKYIKMCEKAREIQEGWLISIGDYYLKRRDCTSPDDMASGYYIEEELIIIGSDDDQCLVFLRRDKDDRDVWLPRQDQLQEMVRGIYEENHKHTLANIKGHKYYDPSFIHRIMFACFSKWFGEEDTYVQQFASSEQLWLAFVMKEKYGKVWNGEDWIKEG